MADVHFSWSDSFQAAFSSCLPCLKGPSSNSDVPSDTDEPTPRANRHNAFAHAIPPPRARPDELEGLLADAQVHAQLLQEFDRELERSRDFLQKVCDPRSCVSTLCLPRCVGCARQGGRRNGSLDDG